MPTLTVDEDMRGASAVGAGAPRRPPPSPWPRLCTYMSPAAPGRISLLTFEKR
jgi:hypothetical protein